MLLWARSSEGSLIADGKTWTGYADSEEEAINEAMGVTVNDYTIESEAKKNPNTHFESAARFQPFAVRDGNLITGQQQHSSRLFSQLIIEALTER
ncbi:MAG: hypothetical protein AB8I08_08605 [Sandaracinaceae bacterium]